MDRIAVILLDLSNLYTFTFPYLIWHNHIYFYQVFHLAYLLPQEVLGKRMGLIIGANLPIGKTSSTYAL